MIQVGDKTDSQGHAAYVHLRVSWTDFQKVRVICGNMFIKDLTFRSTANGAQDTEFEYLVIAERKDGRRITKQQVRDATVAVEAVVNTMKSF